MLFKLIKPLLLPFSVLYGIIMWLRNKLYNIGYFKSVQFSTPVISVGNLSTGGTGKTPHIEYLIQLLQDEYRLATMSRGYKRRTKGFILADAETDAHAIGDEPMQFHSKYPKVTVSVCEDRMTGIPRLLGERPDIDVVLLDDAYQHRTVRPGLNILITDFALPFYKDYILPLGSLRESRKAYKRADIIIVSKCPSDISSITRNSMKEKIKPLQHQHLFFSTIAYLPSINFFTGKSETLSPQSNIMLLSGIAKPEPLLHHLQQLANDVQILQYPDHHYFSESNMADIKQRYENWEMTNKVMVTTEKDATRLRRHQNKLAEWGINIVIMPISINIIEEEILFKSKVRDYIVKQQTEMTVD